MTEGKSRRKGTRLSAEILRSAGVGHNQPQPLLLQEPLLQPPPPPIGFSEVMPNPERGPASTYSTLIEPQVSSRLSSTRNFKSSLS